MELVPLTEDLAAPPPADANLYLPVVPAKPVENTPSKTQDQPRTMSKQASSFKNPTLRSCVENL